MIRGRWCCFHIAVSKLHSIPHHTVSKLHQPEDGLSGCGEGPGELYSIPHHTVSKLHQPEDGLSGCGEGPGELLYIPHLLSLSSTSLRMVWVAVVRVQVNCYTFLTLLSLSSTSLRMVWVAVVRVLVYCTLFLTYCLSAPPA
jgi:hypothetical protein